MSVGTGTRWRPNWGSGATPELVSEALKREKDAVRYPHGMFREARAGSYLLPPLPRVRRSEQSGGDGDSVGTRTPQVRLSALLLDSGVVWVEPVPGRLSDPAQPDVSARPDRGRGGC